MRMRAQAFENVLRQPVFWFDLKSASPGKLVTKLARDAPLVKSVSILMQLQRLIQEVGNKVNCLSIHRKKKRVA